MSSQTGTPGPADQAEVIGFLSDHASHPGTDGVERVETHGNFVFLTGSEAWKIKRAVRFSYMDFSTLERRRVACEHEVAVNRRFSPDLYLGCVPITRSIDGKLAFAGDGETVEWAVHMRRFDQSALLSSIATTGPVTDELANSLAGVVYGSHAGAKRSSTSSGSAPVRTLVSSVCATLGTRDAFDRGDAARLTDGLNAEIDRVENLLDSRAAGTGKTTLAAALAPSIGTPPARCTSESDLERKSAAGVGELERLPARSYTKESSARVYALLGEKAQMVLAAGRSVVVHAVCASEEERRDIEAVAATLGLPFDGIWLTADRETLIARVAARRNDASDATPDGVDAQLLYDTMSPAWRLVDAGGAADETLRRSQLGLKL